MATATPSHPVQRSPYAPLERAVERRLGTDMRLLYGLGVPVILFCVTIALLLGFAASTWMVASLMVLEVGVLGVIMVGFVGVLNSDEDDDER
jgi:hypothetical protein